METLWDCFLWAVPWILGGVLSAVAVSYWISREKLDAAPETRLEDAGSAGKEVSPWSGRGVAWAKDHVAFVGTVSLFVFSVLKVMVVSADIPTALGILQTQGAVTVALGVLMAEIGTLMGLVLVGTYRWFANASDTRSAVIRVQVLVIVLGIAAGLIPCTGFFISVGLLLFMAIVRAPHTRRSGYGQGRRLGLVSDNLLALLVMLILFQGVFSEDMWLPAETIEMSDGTNIIGYVLNEDRPWIPVLTEEDRTIAYIEAESVQTREICVSEVKRLSRTILSFRENRQQASTCPSDAVSHH